MQDFLKYSKCSLYLKIIMQCDTFYILHNQFRTSIDNISDSRHSQTSRKSSSEQRRSVATATELKK